MYGRMLSLTNSLAAHKLGHTQNI